MSSLREAIAQMAASNDRLEQLILKRLDETDAEIARLTRERDLAVAHDRQPYPTAWAYEQACKALEAHRQRAELAEAERDRLKVAHERARKEAINWAGIPEDTDPPDHDDEQWRESGRIMLGLLNLDDAAGIIAERDRLREQITNLRRTAQVWIDIRPEHPTPTREADGLAYAGQQIIAALDQPEETP